MVIIDGIFVSEDIFREQFVCDLSKCKGGCCVEGDIGAPLTDEEADSLERAYPKIKKLLPKEHQKKIEKEGFYEHDRIFGKVTPSMDSGICVYGFYDEGGIVKCALEQRYREGKSKVPKPISCHLFPIRVREEGGFTFLHYSPRPGLCDAACTLGKSLKIPVYQFLKEAITRSFGEEFYAAVDYVGQKYKRTGEL